MPRITVNENGVTTDVTDVEPYRAERETVKERLLAIYADYEAGGWEALAAHEPEICRLNNRLVELDQVLRAWSSAQRRENIAAGWKLVQALRAETDA